MIDVKRIGKYEIIELLGVGGQGEVYKARDMSIGGRIVALKTLDIPGGKPRSYKAQEAFDRFRNEAEITAKLDHPQIAQVFDYGIDPETEKAFIARQFLQGEQLSKLIEKGPIDYDEGLRIVLSLAGVLDYLHKQGVVHRDIKPANIFLQYGIPMIVDFGIAYSEWTDKTKTQTGYHIGTSNYLPPELFDRKLRDKYRYSPSRDWWALGCVAFELFTGKKLFDEEETTILAIAVANKEEQEIIVEELKDHPAFPVVKGLLDRNPEERLNSVNDLKSVMKIKTDKIASKEEELKSFEFKQEIEKEEVLNENNKAVNLVYAEFWRRLIAALIDLPIIIAVYIIIEGILHIF